MRDKILQTLRSAGHGLTITRLWCLVDPYTNDELLLELEHMERTQLVFLHRADGSANTVKGEIVLITLRKEESPESVYRRLLNRKFQN